MRSEQECEQAIARYADMVRRICLLHLKNAADTEDVFQSVFLKYLLHEKSFSDAEHEKAWMIRVTINACKDHLRYLLRHRTTPLEAIPEGLFLEPKRRNVLEAVLALPQKYRDVIYLHYFDGYTAQQIGEILHKKENTVYSLLSRGRDLLRPLLGGDCCDEPDPGRL